MISESTMNTIWGHTIAVGVSLFVLFLLAAIIRMYKSRGVGIFFLNVPAVVTAGSIAYMLIETPFLYGPAIIFSLYCILLWTVEPNYFDYSENEIHLNIPWKNATFTPGIFSSARFFLGLVNAAIIFALYANLFPLFWD